MYGKKETLIMLKPLYLVQIHLYTLLNKGKPKSSGC